MWWSDYSPGLAKGSFFSRLSFLLDNRHYFLIRYLQTAISLSKDDKPHIIDFGCGTGGTTLNMSSYIGLPIDGYDVFPTQIGIANEFSKKIGNGATFHTLNEGKIPLNDASVDIIYSADVLAHVPDIGKVLSEWKRVLKSDGFIVLYTEAACSVQDSSVMGKLAHNGIDMIGSVEEHISLFPKEDLEGFFAANDFNLIRRYSGNVFHFLFNPKEFYTVLSKERRFPFLRTMAYILDRLNKIIPFYPKPQHILRIFLTKLLGRSAYGCNYFYLLQKK